MRCDQCLFAALREHGGRRRVGRRSSARLWLAAEVLHQVGRDQMMVILCRDGAAGPIERPDGRFVSAEVLREERGDERVPLSVDSGAERFVESRLWIALSALTASSTSLESWFTSASGPCACAIAAEAAAPSTRAPRSRTLAR